MNKLIFFCLLAVCSFSVQNIHAGSGNDAEKTEKAASKVNWLTIEQAVALQQKEPRKIFVDVYTDWCGWCKRMDANTFSDPVIAEYLNTEWYPVKFDAEQKSSININGREYKFVSSGYRGYNELANELLNGKLSYPTTVYMDENFNKIQSVPGYLEPSKMDQILKFFGENKYKEMNWEQFIKVYQSPF